MVFTTNILYIGSGTPYANNNKYSNIAMLDSGGQNWEVQSSAFTEALKTNVLSISSSSAFGNNKGKITLARNFEWIGKASGTTTLTANTIYTGSFNFSIGHELYFTYPTLFGQDGRFLAGIGSMNFSLSFELTFVCKNSSMRYFKSLISVKDTNGTGLDNTEVQGVHYRTSPTFNEAIYYNVGPLKHIISAGHSIILVMSYDFTTGSEGASTAMYGTFTIERNPL